MTVILRAADFNTLLLGTNRPYFITHEPAITDQQIAKRDKNTRTVIVGDTLDSCPSCECQTLRGERYLDIPDLVCDVCGTSVTERFVDKLPISTWIKRPDKIEKLMNPQMLLYLRSHFNKNSFNPIDYIILRGYKVAESVNPQIQIDVDKVNAILKNHTEGERGWNAFAKNFWSIIYDLFDQLSRRTSARDYLRFVLEEEDKAGRLFVEAIALPNKLVMMVEEGSNHTGYAKLYADEKLDPIFRTIHAVSGIAHPSSNTPVRTMERRLAEAMINIGEAMRDYKLSFLAGKPGAQRRNMGGTRVDYSIRAVITSISEPHHYDQIEIPWSAAVVEYFVHIAGILIRDYGFGYNEIYASKQAMIHGPTPGNEKHARWWKIYNDIFDKITRESPGGRLPHYHNRNPTLPRASTQLLYAIVKRNPKDKTIGHPNQNTFGFNCDFDGDQMSGALVHDTEQHWLMRYLHPSASYMSDCDPGRVSPMSKLCEPVVLTAGAWHTYLPRQRNHEQEEFLKMLSKKRTNRAST